MPKIAYWLTAISLSLPTVAQAGEWREFFAYFPSDGAVLNEDARAVVDDFIRFQKGCGFNVALTGHTDTLGSAAYNLRLSQRRVKMVADYMVRAGVPAKAIAMTWRGETSPAVDTGDGINEALNRRVVLEMVFVPGDCMEEVDPVSLKRKRTS